MLSTFTRLLAGTQRGYRYASNSSSAKPIARSLRRSVLPDGSWKIPGDKSHPLAHTVSKHMSIKPVTAITTSESYDLNKVIELLFQKGYQPVNLIPNEIVTFKYFHEGLQGDVMVIGQNGSVVSWGFDEASHKLHILPLIDEARTNPLPESLYESEDLDYVEVESKEEWNQISSLGNMSGLEQSFIKEDLIVVDRTSGDKDMLDKAAFSSGISRSTMLAVLERNLEAHIESTRSFTELLSRGSKLNITEAEILKSTGRLFLMRGKLNLYSELIETPDLYWSEPTLENIYKQVSRNLDVPARISILNKKLDYATDESRALMSVLNEKKSTRLEWIIIYLITVEVCFELHHFYERFLDSKPNVHTSLQE
ncbi:AaceriAAL122Cp [[Ashbya] aceris (nom. inval.)]|nr:AaceriAAL122Cp [[Ashbya] aceris (nom. inval.)]